jgi:hypothetical protein
MEDFLCFIYVGGEVFSEVRLWHMSAGWRRRDGGNIPSSVIDEIQTSCKRVPNTSRLHMICVVPVNQKIPDGQPLRTLFHLPSISLFPYLTNVFTEAERRTCAQLNPIMQCDQRLMFTFKHVFV